MAFLFERDESVREAVYLVVVGAEGEHGTFGYEVVDPRSVYEEDPAFVRSGRCDHRPGLFRTGGVEGSDGAVGEDVDGIVTEQVLPG